MNPIAFKIFGFEIRYYSLFILTGVILAYFLIVKEAKRFKIKEDEIFNMFFYTLIVGIIGARAYYVLFTWEYFGRHIDEIIKIWEGGLAIHGGIIAGTITIAIYCKHHNLNLLKILDIISPAVILAQSIGRWGNFFNSEAYGAATTLGHLKSLHIPGFIIKGMKINGIYYTPTFFYESLWCLLGFIIMIIIRRFKLIKTGQIFSFYLIWYGIGRFFIESLRTDSLIFMGFKAAQIVSIIMIIIGILINIFVTRKGKYEDLYNN